MEEVDINQLAEFMFLHNKKMNKIQLDIDGIGNKKDFFCFCLDLFTKGLRLMHGDEKGQVNVDSLTIDDITNIRSKLILAGIVVNIETMDNNMTVISDANNNKQNKVSYQGISVPDIEKENHELLEEYKFHIISKHNIYEIFFSMIKVLTCEEVENQ